MIFHKSFVFKNCTIDVNIAEPIIIDSESESDDNLIVKVNIGHVTKVTY